MWRRVGIIDSWHREVKEQLLVILVAVSVTFTVIYLSGTGWAVTVNGKMIGVVKNRAVVTATLKEILRANAALGQPGRPGYKVTYRRVRVAQRDCLPQARLKERLEEALALYARATVVQVNGQDRFFFRDRRAATAFLQAVVKMYAARPEEEATFAERITLATRRVPISRLMGVTEAVAVVRQGIEERWYYRVKEGDTLWDIARAQGLAVEDVIAANPGMNPDHLSVGQVIKLRCEKPVFTVVQEYETTKVEPIPFPREIRYDRSLHRGQVKIVKQGRPGKKEITYRIKVENGVEVSQTVIGTMELEAPVKQIERRGSRYLLASRGDGRASLGWPLSGPILSGFGIRWGRMHTGIDIGSGYGTPVGAASGGTVIRAGWYGGYGRTVDIDHGNGVVTRYAHLASISVGIGEVVERGEVIGTVGSSGHAYGPHLHFEVLVNGEPRNPLSYL
ncbi:peptidoglycan DD-metalloendopeptidase family protein [Thermodesulfitimonas sp.]